MTHLLEEHLHPERTNMTKWTHRIVRTSDRDGFKAGQECSKHKSFQAAQKQLKWLASIKITDMKIEEIA
jgi:hypothetical protein